MYVAFLRMHIIQYCNIALLHKLVLVVLFYLANPLFYVVLTMACGAQRYILHLPMRYAHVE